MYKLNLNDTLCNRIEYLYEKAHKLGIPRRPKTVRTGAHYYFTESLAACIHLSVLERNKRYPYHSQLQRIVAEVNDAIDNVELNKYYRYKSKLKASRVEDCTRLLKQKLALNVTIPETKTIRMDHDVLRLRNDQRLAIKSAICDICEKLELQPRLTLARFDTMYKKLGDKLNE
jgi:hypothetical protein